MLHKRILALVTALVCLLGTVTAAGAVQVDSDGVYCFTPEDFAEENLAGICITYVPDPQTGTLMLGSRVLRSGDVLTADQVAQMTFCPAASEEDMTVSVSCLPIYSDRVDPEITMTISIRGKENKAPVAENTALETYKNIPLDGNLKVKDPEGESMTYAVARQPRRGSVEIREDGTFTYTPKKNKVGVDSFTFTATDAGGKISREATVTVTILKPADATQYTDTLGKDCRFAAEWMKNTGIFVGETVAQNPCFSPDKAVTRGEYVTMLVRALEIPTDEAISLTGYGDEIPAWLKPYLAAAVRSGLTEGLPEREIFGADEPITVAEAAVMLQNALDLTADSEAAALEDVPQWAADAVAVMNANGFSLGADAPLTRGEAAKMLYQAVQLADSAPGMMIIRMQQ